MKTKKLLFAFLLSAVMVTAMSSISMASLPQPVAYYNFDGQNANDTSGYGTPANGTVNGGTFVSDGAGGYYLYLNGNASVAFGTPSKLNLSGAGTTESFAFWMYPTSTTSIKRDILRKGDTGYRLRYNEINDTIEFSHKTDDSDYGEGGVNEWNISIVRGGNVPPNQWHHVVGVYNAGDDFLSNTPSFSLYIDGKLVSVQRGANVAPYNVGDPVNIGWTTDGFVGYLDHVLIYNTALSISQVRELGFTSKAWDPYPNGPIEQALPTGTVLTWNSGNGTTAHKVYFGTNPNPGSGEYKGQQTANTYNPGTLVGNTTYYWRIDEVTGSGDVTGDVWSFKAIGGYDSHVANNNGVYEINVDGNWYMRPGHCTSHVRNEFTKDFALTGTDGHELGICLPGTDYPPYERSVWTGYNTYNFNEMDNAIERILANCPNAKIMIRASGIAPPQWWLNSHSSEWELIDNGSGISSNFNDSTDNPRSGPFVSLASATYRTEMANAWRDIIKYIEQAGYADHIVGYSLGGLRTGESYLWDCDRSEVMGYSEHFKTGFRNWLKTRYSNNVSSLRSAWNDSGVTFENAQPPSRGQCANEGGYTFRNASERVRIVDFYRYKAELTVETYDYFAGVIKAAHTKPKYVICYYGMMNEFEGRDKFGHNAVYRVCSAPNLDGIIVTASYTNRWFASGLDAERSPSYSLQLNGKFWHNDNDMATFMSDYNSDPTYGDQQLGWTHNETDSRRMMRRAAGFSLAKNMQMVWFELQEGIYNNAGLQAESTAINTMCTEATTKDCSSNAQILVVADEVSNSFCPWQSKLTRDTLRNGIYEFNRVGAPFDQILLTDLSKINASRYKLIVFMNCYNCFDDQRTAINNLKGGNRTLVFVYCTGYHNSSSASTGNMNGLTSINMSVGSESFVPLRTTIQTGHPLANAIANAGYSTFGKTESVAKKFWVNDGGATTLGKYSGSSDVSFALRDQGSWKAIYLANSYADAGVWREIARWAGVHIYNDRSDAFYGNSSYLTVHANGGGDRTLNFPTQKNVYDPFNGSLLASSVSSYYLGNLSSGETRIVRISAPIVNLPTLTNSSGASNVTVSGARLNGQVTDTGGSAPNVNIYWGTTDGGTTYANWPNLVSVGIQGGTFYADISGLSPNTTYYYRCYGQNSAGVDWADTAASFTTPASGVTAPTITNSSGASNVTVSAARLNGQVTNTGGSAPNVNIYWGTTDGGTNSGNWGHLAGVGTQGGTFYTDISGLSPSTTYYYRCYGQNSAGTDWADTSASFTTPASGVTVPTITNSTGASNVTANAARLNGQVTVTGGDAPNVNIYWGTSDGGTTYANWGHLASVGIQGGTFYADISGLSPNTTYYYRCYGQNSAGIDWADTTASFTTPASTGVGVFTNHQDIGAVTIAGSATWNGTTYGIMGTGADIWGTADAFHYAWLTKSNNCTLTVKVTWVRWTDASAKSGLMIRDNVNANSAYAGVFVNPNGQVCWQRRYSSGGSSTASSWVGSAVFPKWIRLIRSSNTFTAQYSSDNVNWTNIGSNFDVSMTQTNYMAGLGVCSHNTTNYGEGQFTNFSQ